MRYKHEAILALLLVEVDGFLRASGGVCRSTFDSNGQGLGITAELTGDVELHILWCEGSDNARLECTDVDQEISAAVLHRGELAVYNGDKAEPSVGKVNAAVQLNSHSHVRESPAPVPLTLTIFPLSLASSPRPFSNLHLQECA
jgi:hypothetical protein